MGTLTPQQRYLASLVSFQYPLDPSCGPASDPAHRRLDWQMAFCALYDAYRAGVCPAFYVIPPEGAKQAGRSGIVLFGAEGIGGRAEDHVLLTRSSGGLRLFLANRCDLEPQVPLIGNGGNNALTRDDKVG